MPTTPAAVPRKLTTGGAARVAGAAAETIRSWERRGWLAAERTASGLRLFNETDVLRVAAARAAARTARAASTV